MSKYSDVHLHDSPGQQIPNPGRVYPFKAKFSLLTSQALSSFRDLVRNGPDHPDVLDTYLLGAPKRLSCQTPSPPPRQPGLLCFRRLGPSPLAELSKRMDGARRGADVV